MKKSLQEFPSNQGEELQNLSLKIRSNQLPRLFPHQDRHIMRSTINSIQSNQIGAKFSSSFSYKLANKIQTERLICKTIGRKVRFIDGKKNKLQYFYIKNGAPSKHHGMNFSMGARSTFGFSNTRKGEGNITDHEPMDWEYTPQYESRFQEQVYTTTNIDIEESEVMEWESV